MKRIAQHLCLLCALFVAVAASAAERPVKTLIVGGGSSHDFNRWFNQADSATLKSIGNTEVSYTEDLNSVAARLKDLDVLYLATNNPMTNDAVRAAIFDFANAGKGVLLIHPALWYNWRNWPEYNRDLVGGGSRSHDRFGEFEVTVTQPGHPIMAGLPKTFKITDELYHHQLDPKGTDIEVLATGFEKSTGKTFPVVWISKQPKSRVVCITLGHDGKAHELPEFQTLLKNSFNWVAKPQ